MDDFEKFDVFISSYKNYHISISEISKPCPKHENECPKYKNQECTSKRKTPLIDCSFPMYSFDDICRTCKTIDLCNLPSTVDAIHFNKDKKELYFIEFKGVRIDNKNQKKELENILKKMNKEKKQDDFDYYQEPKKNCHDKYYKKLKRIYSMYGDELAYKLRLKPFESIYMALPRIYEDYCEKENIPIEKRLNIHDFLFNSSVKKYFYVVAVSDNKNSSIEHLDTYRYLLRKPFNRLKDFNLFDMVDILNPNQFKILVKNRLIDDF